MRSSAEIIGLIKNLREEKGLTLDELSKRVGVAKSTLSRYESGQRAFPVNDIGLYADVLNTTVEHLLGLKKSPRREFSIPLVGTICAGDGLLAEQNVEEYIQYPFPSHKQPDFALRVKGDSMKGVGIDNGDIVFMRSAQWAERNGQIVAAIVNDGTDGTLKRMCWSDQSNKITLMPENEEYDSIELMPNQIIVSGVYMGHFKPEREI
ncbi:LexA family transcriptional regulator [Cohnella sp. GbtcB17]|uniref:LexA family protein n=1 Tax=Cohnella sp. GbtcB17 TaxID=2824762 RepID=UPI001C30D410|nr:S24 family peptidase [Cohnella sp. GbtcB17]